MSIQHVVDQLRRGIIAIALHGLLLCGLFFYHIDGKPIVERFTVLTDLAEEIIPPERMLDLTPPEQNDNISFSAVADLSSKSMAESIQPAEMTQTALPPSSQAAALATLGDKSLIRPVMQAAAAGLTPSGTVRGLAGLSVNASGDAGSVDRITVEILRRLESGKVLVVWVMDSTASLRPRREEIIRRFDRVYEELGELNRNDALMTGIVGFGSDIVFQTPRPTDDQEAIRQAVRQIKDDNSGIENVFGAIKEVSLRWRRYQTQGKYQMMLVVLTDERGNDMVLLDEATALCKRNNIATYVIGPPAPFGRVDVEVPYTENGETVMIPIERGPETVQPELLQLPFWGMGGNSTTFSSGFGPYGLTRLAQDTGGLYFITDDKQLVGERYPVDIMMQYSPDYQPLQEYLKSITKSPLRQAVVRSAANSKGPNQQPPMLFRATEIGPVMTEAQRIVAETRHFVDQALGDMRQVEKDRKKESSRRWQAHYDLIMGRLLATKVRCDEYNWALASMRTNPRTFKNPKNNAWRLIGDNANISFGSVSPDAAKSQTNVKKADPKTTAQAKADADSAMVYLKRVASEHPDTPWATMAQRELAVPMGFRWDEAYIPPPPQPGTPEAANAAEAMESMRRREELRKKRL